MGARKAPAANCHSRYIPGRLSGAGAPAPPTLSECTNVRLCTARPPLSSSRPRRELRSGRAAGSITRQLRLEARRGEVEEGATLMGRNRPAA